MGRCRHIGASPVCANVASHSFWGCCWGRHVSSSRWWPDPHRRSFCCLLLLLYGIPKRLRFCMLLLLLLLLLLRIILHLCFVLGLGKRLRLRIMQRIMLLRLMILLHQGLGLGLRLGLSLLSCVTIGLGFILTWLRLLMLTMLGQVPGRRGRPLRSLLRNKLICLRMRLPRPLLLGMVTLWGTRLPLWLWLQLLLHLLLGIVGGLVLSPLLSWGLRLHLCMMLWILWRKLFLFHLLLEMIMLLGN